MITMSSERLRAAKRDKEKFVTEWEQEQARPLNDKKRAFERLSSEVALAERQLAAMELLSTPNNAELAKRVPVFVPSTPAQSEETLRKLIQGAYYAAKLVLEERGYRLLPSFDEKVRRILGLNCTLDFTGDGLTAIVEYALDLGVFAEGKDIISPEPVAEPEPEPKPESIEDFDTSTRAGTAKGRKWVAEQLWSENGEAKAIWRDFEKFISDTYGVVMTTAQKKQCIDFCIARNLGYTHKAFDECRTAVLKLYTPQEQLALELENQTEPVGSYESRVAFAKRHREIANQ